MEVVASLSQDRTAAAQCGFFTHRSVPVIFEPPCIMATEMVKLWPILINHLPFCNKHVLSTLFPLLVPGTFFFFHFRRFTLMVGLYQNAAFQETTIAHLE